MGLDEGGPIGQRFGDAASSSKGKGFSIGSDGKIIASTTESKKSDLFSSLSGKAISLASHASNVASDFMTEEPEEEPKEERLEKERKKQAKLLEKMRKKDKKGKKKKRKNRKRDEESDDEDEGGSSLLANLEATAVADGANKRSRGGADQADAAAEDDAEAKRARFESIMAKGAERTQRAFSRPIKATVSAVKQETDDESDGGEDDAFLNAALAKARRLKRLKEMSGAAAPRVKGEDAVVQAVTQQKEQEARSGNGSTNNADGGLKYEYDEMQEFTRALRAREDQAKRTKDERKARGVTITLAKKKPDQPESAESETNGDGSAGIKREPSEVEDVTMEELATEIKDDDPAQSSEMGLSSTANSSGVGRGLSGFLSLLKKTGEISTTAPKEEMRGRAKDERTYEDYAGIDLGKVVQTEGRHEKDVELANREIKLEYRDDYGRLLTRKEAYRNMCYQFHGHGSRMKNQERRLKQIDRERAEAKVASRSEEGVFGALKATQRATGKAFIIHKT